MRACACLCVRACTMRGTVLLHEPAVLSIGVSLQLGRERVRTQNRPYAVAAGPSALLTASALPIDPIDPSRSAVASVGTRAGVGHERLCRDRLGAVEPVQRLMRSRRADETSRGK